MPYSRANLEKHVRLSLHTSFHTIHPMTPLRILFMGTPSLVVPVLKTLNETEHFQIIAAVTQPDQPVGRKQLLTPSPIKQYSQEHNIPTLAPTKLTLQFQQQLVSHPRPDVAVLAAYGKIIPQWLLDWPQHGIINIHPSLLPAYRGATPTLGPLLRGEIQTGVTFMLMDAQLDHGPIISQTTSHINPEENRDQLTMRLFQEASQILPHIIDRYTNSPHVTTSPANILIHVPATPQDHSQATYVPLLNKADGFLPWELISAALANQPAPLTLFPNKIQTLVQDIYQPTATATFVHNAIRALSPWPGAWTYFTHQNQQKRLKLLTSRLQNNTLFLNQVQIEGKTPQEFSSLNN